MGDHQVKENAWVTVLEGTVRISAGGESVDAAPGMLFRFDPDERHSLASDEGARILLPARAVAGRRPLPRQRASASASSSSSVLAEPTLRPHARPWCP